MDKPFLPKILTLTEAIEELQLDEDKFSHYKAVNYLLKYAQYDGLKIHFRADIMGYDINKPITETKQYGDFSNRLMIDEEVSYFEDSSYELLYRNGSYKEGQEDSGFISVFRFQCDDVEYYSVDEAGQFVVSTKIKEENFHIYRNDLKDFISYMEGEGSQDGAHINNEVQYISDAAYLDKDHKNYSEELHAAIDAWLSANSGNDDKYGSSFKSRVEDYLKISPFKLNTTAAKRVAIVANSKNNKRNIEK